MFTGLIEEVGKVNAVSDASGTRRIRIAAPRTAGQLRNGDSVSVSGVCLTALDVTGGTFSADLAAETLARTSLSRIEPGTSVNLELAMAGNSDRRFGGHMVQGHVDGVGRLASLAKIHGREDYWLTVTLPRELAKYVVEKGSITVEGISLTVAGVEGLALRMQEVLRAIEVNDGAHRRALGCEAEQAVVGADEHEAIGLDQDRPACGTHARIDHREVDRSRREVRHRAGQHERSAGHVLGRYVVAQIDDSGGRTDSEQHPLDDADEAVSLAEIGEQRDDRGVRSFRYTLRRCGGSSRCCRRTPTVRAHGRSISSRSAAHSSGNMIS